MFLPTSNSSNLVFLYLVSEALFIGCGPAAGWHLSDSHDQSIVMSVMQKQHFCMCKKTKGTQKCNSECSYFLSMQT